MSEEAPPPEAAGEAPARSGSGAGDAVWPGALVGELAPEGDAQADPIDWTSSRAALFSVLGCATLICWLSVSGLFSSEDLPDAHDVDPHILNTVEYARCFSDGLVWPRWLPDLSGGYGGPNPLYYAPLTYHVTGRAHQLGLSVVASLKLAATLSMVASFFGMFLWASRIWLWPGGLVAATLYTLAPYHLFDLYVRFSLPELMGLAVAPWIFYWTCQALEGERDAAFKLVGVGLAVMLVFHAISVVLFGGLWVSYLLCHFAFRGGAAAVWRALGAVPLAIGLSAFYWVPMVFDQGLTRIPLDRSMQWAWALSLLAPERLLDHHWPGHRSHLPLYVGWLHLALVAVALVSALAMLRFRPRPVTAFLLFFGATLGHACLVLEPSRFVWAHSPLATIQFPWRFLAPVSLGIAFLAPMALWTLRDRFGFQVAVCLALCLAIGWHYRALCSHKTRRVMVPSAEELREGCQTGDFENKYVPAGAHDPPYPRGATFEVASGAAALTVLASSAQYHRVRVEAWEPSTVEVRIYHFDGWRAEIDGQEVELSREEGIGGMRLRVSPGTHELVVRFGFTPLWGWALALSVATAVALGVGMAGPRLWLVGLVAVAVASIGLAVQLGQRVLSWGADHDAHEARLALLRHDYDEAIQLLRRIEPASAHAAWARVTLDRLRGHGWTARFGPMRWQTPLVTRPEYILSFHTEAQPGAIPIPCFTTGLYTARLKVPSRGRYRLALESDDGSALWIDRRQIIGQGDLPMVSRREAAVDLEAGDREIAVFYFNGRGAAMLRVWWCPPASAWTIVPVELLSPATFDWADRLARTFPVAPGAR